MTTEQMREKLAEAYSGPKWQLRLAQMEDRQIVAIYKCMKQTGQLERKKLRKKMEPGIRKAIQITIFDLPEFNDLRQTSV